LVKFALNYLKVNGKTLKECFEMLRSKEFCAVKMVKCLLGLPVIYETEDFGVMFSPKLGSEVNVMHKVDHGVRYNTYIGAEEINFRYGETKGSFTHDGQVFNQMVIFFVNLEEFKQVSLMIEFVLHNH